MRSIAAAILIVILLGALVQSLIETSNVLKEKVTLGAAVLNSGRAAHNNSLEDGFMSPSELNDTLGNLSAVTNEALFRRHFAEAFSTTLKMEWREESSGSLTFFTRQPDARWENITVTISFSYEQSTSGGEAAVARISLSTPYKFRTSLLGDASALLSNDFNITENKILYIQIVN